MLGRLIQKKDNARRRVMQEAAHLLVFPGGDVMLGRCIQRRTMRGAVWKDSCGPAVMRGAAHLLVFPGGDFLQEVGCALARRQPEAQRLEEGHHLLARPMVDQAACT